jgi:tetratricopeptide (TPR) repeat protein
MRYLTVAVSVCLSLGLAACRKADAPDGGAEASAAAQPCAMALAPHQGTGDVDEGIARSQQAARDAANPAEALNDLGQRYIARARVSQSPTYYAMAEFAALCAESKDPGNAQALLLRGHVLHQQHRFKEAEVVARAVTAKRGLYLDHGLLGDVLLELGHVEQGGQAYQRMMDLKPYYHSYTRASHYRWLKGDLPGALQLIQQAVRTASPRDPESVAWAYSRLAAYELQAGRTSESLRASEAALQHQANYAAALLIRGRALLSDRRHGEAVETLRRAALAGALPEHEWALADALRAAGDLEEARRVEQRLNQTGATSDPRTFALYLATRRERPDEAVALAEQELRNRNDVFTFDALAWTLASAGRMTEAEQAMTRALAEGTKDARLFYHAGVIAASKGHHAEARRWLREAQAVRQMLLPSEQQDVTGRLNALNQAQNRRKTI